MRGNVLEKVETVSQRVATFEISTLQLSNKLNRPVPFSPNL